MDDDKQVRKIVNSVLFQSVRVSEGEGRGQSWRRLPNTRENQCIIAQRVADVLSRRYPKSEGFMEVDVICNESNNFAETVAQGLVNIDIVEKEKVHVVRCTTV